MRSYIFTERGRAEILKWIENGNRTAMLAQVCVGILKNDQLDKIEAMVEMLEERDSRKI